MKKRERWVGDEKVLSEAEESVLQIQEEKGISTGKHTHNLQIQERRGEAWSVLVELNL